MGKTYSDYNRELREFQDGRRQGKRLPKPNLRDVDIDTVPPEKRELIKELAEREPK